MTRLLAEIRHALVMAGYWIRPYDMLADRRRWRWQRAARCGLPAVLLAASADRQRHVRDVIALGWRRRPGR